MQRRHFGLVFFALLLVAMTVRHPSADIRINLHDAADVAPQRIVAAIDMGLMAVSVLITWTRRLG